jgi:hypothetical protein
MKKSKKTPKPAVRQRRFSIKTFVIVGIVIAAAGVTVASRQLASSKVTKAAENPTPAVSLNSGNKYVTVKVAGREVQVDPQTGKIKPLTPEEAQQLADGLKTMLNKSTEGLEQVKQADGTVSMDLKGRFRNVAVARTNDDGSVEESCVDEPEQAAAFFGIDPKLLGVQSTRTLSSQPVVKTPARKVSQ